MLLTCPLFLYKLIILFYPNLSHLTTPVLKKEKENCCADMLGMYMTGEPKTI